MLSLFNWVSVWGTWMGPVMGIYPNLGLIYFFDSRMWEDCWPEGQLVWSSVVWNVRAISSSQCINKLPLTLRTLGNILPLSWVFPYKPKWDIVCQFLGSFLNISLHVLPLDCKLQFGIPACIRYATSFVFYSR